MSIYTQKSIDIMNQSLCNLFGVEFIYIDSTDVLQYEPVTKLPSPFAGYRHTDESKRKMSEKRVGKDNGKRKGIPNSPEQRRKISEANKGREHTLEERRAISDGLKGKIKSPEHKRKLSESKLGTTLSDETKLKMSKARKGVPKPKFICIISSRKELDKANYTKWLARQASKVSG